MPETSGTWLNAACLAVAVYRGAAVPAADGVNINAGSASTAENWPARTPTTYPAALGTHWWLGFGTSDTATNLSTAPAGMSNVASTTHIGVHDSGGPVSTNWPSTNVTLNASGKWTTGIVQIPAAGTVSRVGCAAAEATSVPIPPGHQVGDLMVMHAVAYGPSIPTAPAGWSTLSGSFSSSTLSLCIFYKLAAVSDFLPRIAVY